MLTVAAVILVTFVLVGTSRGPSDMPIQTVFTSWAVGYSSTADLGAHADLVVVGTNSSVASEGPDQFSPSVAATRYVVSVDRFVKGSGNKSIVVKQTGGRLGNVRQVVEDDPQMVVGQRYLLYLALVPDGPYAGDYFVLGGPQGRFAVDAGGSLTPIGSVPAPAGVTGSTITVDP